MNRLRSTLIKVNHALASIAITLQGIKIRRVADDRITVTLPDFRHPRTDRMCTAIILPRELSDAIGSTVAQAYNTLDQPTLAPDPTRGVTGTARIWPGSNCTKSDYARGKR